MQRPHPVLTRSIILRHVPYVPVAIAYSSRPAAVQHGPLAQLGHTATTPPPLTCSSLLSICRPSSSGLLSNTITWKWRPAAAADSSTSNTTCNQQQAKHTHNY